MGRLLAVAVGVFIVGATVMACFKIVVLAVSPDDCIDKILYHVDNNCRDYHWSVSHKCRIRNGLFKLSFCVRSMQFHNILFISQRLFCVSSIEFEERKKNSVVAYEIMEELKNFYKGKVSKIESDKLVKMAISIEFLIYLCKVRAFW